MSNIKQHNKRVPSALGQYSRNFGKSKLGAYFLVFLRNIQITAISANYITMHNLHLGRFWGQTLSQNEKKMIYNSGGRIDQQFHLYQIILVLVGIIIRQASNSRGSRRAMLHTYT